MGEKVIYHNDTQIERHGNQNKHRSILLEYEVTVTYWQYVNEAASWRLAHITSAKDCSWTNDVRFIEMLEHISK